MNISVPSMTYTVQHVIVGCICGAYESLGPLNESLQAISKEWEPLNNYP